MTTLAIREKLSNYMHVADDKKVKAIYEILKNEIDVKESISLKKYNKEIKKAEKEFKKGKNISQKKLEKIASKW
jgi:type II secretory ATPase GspE/PulE/Tfp pilus assembly ATPase PilB-like protein